MNNFDIDPFFSDNLHSYSQIPEKDETYTLNLDINVNPETEAMFQRTFEAFTLSSKKYLSNVNGDEAKICEMLLEDYMKHSKTPEHSYAMSPMPSTTESTTYHSDDNSSPQVPLEVVKTPKRTLKKRAYKELSDNESDYNPEGDDDYEEVFVTQKKSAAASKKRPTRKASEESFDSDDSRSTKHSEKELECSWSTKGGQNKMKNNQGTFAGKMKALCKKDKDTNQDTRLFAEATAEFAAEEKEEFRTWANSYDKKWKTWATLKSFLASKQKFGVVFVNMIILFLSERFRKEYDEFITNGHMGKDTKNLLRRQDSKAFYTSKFNLVLDELHGEQTNFEHSIKKSRKSLKVL